MRGPYWTPITPLTGSLLHAGPHSDHGADPGGAFPGHGQMRPEQLEIERLRRENAKLKAERDILKKAAAYFAMDSI